MKCIALFSLGLGLPLLLSAADYRPDVGRNLGFTIYTNAPPGKQLSGVYKATETPPLHPLETQKKFKVPKGFEVRLFASEPEVVNPVAMTWDERGRLWVLELYEYPKGVPKGQKGRDRIKILEDVDADGKADKVTVFADGFSLATGLALGNGGVYLGQAPNLYFLEDTDGDDKADKTTVLKTGFGMEDRHELLNGFAWGPDGWLYMTHGVFTHSKVKDPNNPKDDGVQMDAALARYHPTTKKFEVFADGTSNPWGVDWNERGDAFVSACVIQHLFHMAPGGQYNRQGGTWANPYGYVGDLPSKGLPAIVDWRHYRAAHAGICIYRGDQWPAEWRGLAYLGNIHQSAINCDRLEPVGSTYKATKESTLLGQDKGTWEVGAGNFLVCDDHWFRPVSNQTGPDGAMWIMDWSDKYPCYQNAQADPEGVDRELGRIWRVVWTGDQPGKAVPSRPGKDMNLAKLSTKELAGLLENENNWQRRQGQRLLTERKDKAAVPALEKLLKDGQATQVRLAALWTLHGQDAPDDDFLLNLTKEDTNSPVRAWAARIMGERAT
jgi:putative membrane-bound dehydrogenase-like protein